MLRRLSLGLAFFLLAWFLSTEVQADNAFAGCTYNLPNTYVTMTPPRFWGRYMSATQCFQACDTVVNPTPVVPNSNKYRNAVSFPLSVW